MTIEGRPSTGHHVVWTHDHVRYSDLDPNGHVNNIAYAEYIAAGRVAFLEYVTDLGAQVEPMVLRYLAIDYLGELRRPAHLRIGAYLEHLGTRSFTVGVDLHDGDQLAARSQSVAVVLGTEGAIELTSSTREVLESLCGEQRMDTPGPPG